MQTRDQLQSEAIQTLKKHKRLILNWGTGVGKSRVAVIASKELVAAKPQARILLIVQETAHKKNWKDEFVKSLGEEEAADVLSHMDIQCYASLKKYSNTGWDFIIFDEGHHLRSPLRQTIVYTMRAERVLILSATISERGDGTNMLETLECSFGPFQQLSFGIQDAIDNEILSEPEVNIIPVVLTESQRAEYDKLSETIERKKCEYVECCREYGITPFSRNENDETEGFLNSYLFATGLRKRFIGSKKTTVGKMMLRNVLADKKYICFCANVKQVQWLSGENYICSEKTKKQNAEVIEAFNNDEIRSLFAVGMLQEGQNLKGIEAGLIVQLDGKGRSFVQRFGRVMRSLTPVVYLLYIKDTRDEDYLATALEVFDKKEYLHYWEPVYTSGHKTGETVIDTEDRKSVGTQVPAAPTAVSGDVPEDVFTVMQTEGCFVCDNLLYRSLAGRLTGIDKEGTGYYRIRLYNSSANRNYTIILHKKLSIGMIASLASSKVKADTDLQIGVQSDGNWAKYTIKSKSGLVIQWKNGFMADLPKVINGNDRDRIAYLDEEVRLINKRLGYTEA